MSRKNLKEARQKAGMTQEVIYHYNESGIAESQSGYL